MGNLLPDIVLEDDKILLGEIRDRFAVPINDPHIDWNEHNPATNDRWLCSLCGNIRNDEDERYGPQDAQVTITNERVAR